MRHVTYLVHHGIKGQEWGVKNGPPYPLDKKTHNSVISGEDLKKKKSNWKAAVEQHKKELKDFKKSEISKKVDEAQRNWWKSPTDENYQKWEDLYNEYERQKEELDRKYEKEEKQAYREWMASKLPEKADFYKNCTDKELNDDIAKKQRIKKILIGTGIVAGVAAAAYLTYRYNVIKQAKADDIHKALKEQLVDMDLILNKDSPIQRIVGTPGFDLSKIGNDGMYASFTKADKAVYEGMLRVRSGNKRIAVKLKTTKDVKIAGEKSLENIFDKLYNDPNSGYKKALADSVRSMLTTPALRAKLSDDDDAIKFGASAFGGSKFGYAMYSMVFKGSDSKIFFKACEEQKYDAILDMFDRRFGGFGDKILEAPVIFLNPQNALVKTGEKAVEETIAESRGMQMYNLLKQGKGVYQDVFWKFVNGQ